MTSIRKGRYACALMNISGKRQSTKPCAVMPCIRSPPHRDGLRRSLQRQGVTVKVVVAKNVDCPSVMR